MILFAGFVLAMFSTMLLIPPLIRVAYWLGFVDVPNNRKVHKGSIPRIGGVAFFVGSMLPLLLWADLSEEVIGFLLGGVAIVVFGLLDDRFELGFKSKLVGQVIGSLCVIYYGGISVTELPALMGGEGLPPAVSVPLTLFLVVSVTNAINFSDGLDGLAGGVVLVSLVVIALMAFESEQLGIAIICVTLSGALLGFLQFNSHPAKLFMGDTGSQFLGYTIAVLAIWLTQNDFSAYASSIPILLVGLPLIDIVVVTFNRVIQGKSPFAPDKTHFHHRMLSLGLDHIEAVMVIYLVQVSLVGAAYLLRFDLDQDVIGFFCLVLASYFIVFLKADTFRQMFRPQFFAVGSSPLARKVNYLRKDGGFSKLSCFYIAGSIALFYAYGVIVTPTLETNYALLALAMFLVLITFRLKLKNNFTEWLERIAYYGVACSLIFLVEPVVEDSNYTLTYFIALGVVVLIGMHYTRDVRATLKPMDVLVLIIVLALPKVFSSLGLDERYAFSAFYVLVLFYAIELLLLTSIYHCGQQKYIKVGLLLPLLVLGLRGIV